MPSLAVTIPTRNRPEKLQRCLSALAQARERIPFEAYVGDASDEATVRKAVQTVCEEFEFVHFFQHSGKNAAAARNFCAQVADAELLVSVDDDAAPHPDWLACIEAHFQAELMYFNSSSGWVGFSSRMALEET